MAAVFLNLSTSPDLYVDRLWGISDMQHLIVLFSKSIHKVL